MARTAETLRELGAETIYHDIFQYIDNLQSTRTTAVICCYMCISYLPLHNKLPQNLPA